MVCIPRYVRTDRSPAPTMPSNKSSGLTGWHRCTSSVMLRLSVALHSLSASSCKSDCARFQDSKVPRNQRLGRSWFYDKFQPPREALQISSTQLVAFSSLLASIFRNTKPDIQTRHSRQSQSVSLPLLLHHYLDAKDAGRGLWLLILECHLTWFSTGFLHERKEQVYV